MAWYYYSGNVVRSIPVKAGLSRVVKPHSKIEIIAETKEFQAMKKRGLFRRTSPQKGALPGVAEDVAELKVEDVLQKSEMAKAVAEKGVTKSKGIAPTKPKGKPEMTEAELTSVRIKDDKKADVLKSEVKVDSKKKKKKDKGGSKEQSR